MELPSMWTLVAVLAPVLWVWILRMRMRMRGSVHTADIANYYVDQQGASGSQYDINRFILASDSSTNATAAKKRYDADDDPTIPKAAIALFFGTEYGFSKEIAEKTAEKLYGLGTRPTVYDLADFDEGLDFNAHQFVLMICSTQGDGVPPNSIRAFYDWLQQQKPGKFSFKFSVLALGDKSYTHYCRCGRGIDSKLEEIGGVRSVPRTDVDKENWKAVHAWQDAVCEALPSLGLVARVADGAATSGAAKTSKKSAWNKSRPFPAVLKKKELITKLVTPEDKETVHFEFDLLDSGLKYLPGDALGIYAPNSSTLVETLIKLLHLDGKKLVPVPRWHYQTGDTRPETMTLFDALTHCYDLHTPKPSLLSHIVSALPASETTRREKLEVLLQDAENDFAGSPLDQYFQPRHVEDILREFPSAKISLDGLLDSLRPLQPRLYSISSSQRQASQTVTITVAIVRYTSLDQERGGVATTYLCDKLKLNDTLPVYIHSNPDFRLPATLETPIIMVGPGTGLAPFMSFIWDRLLQSVGSSSRPRQLLFFGCRHEQRDFLYSAQLRSWNDEKVIELSTAFSRDQGSKVYVQNRIRSSGKDIWDLLVAGAHFYVCGDASSMAGQVEQELLGIAQKYGSMDAAAAGKWLEDLSAQHRYERDVWF